MMASLDALNEEFRREGLPVLTIGIGINYGTVTVGYIGSTERHNYSAIGDAVNVAARLEGLTKDLGRKILITEAVVSRIEERFQFDPLGSHNLKGHSPVMVWGIRTVRAAGYIRNSEPEQVLEDCDRALTGGAAVIVFPEGTRTRPNEPLKFLRGAAHIAVKSGRPIVPVLLQCDPPTLTKGSSWHHIPPRPFCFRVIVRDELAPQRLADLREPPVIAARRLTRALESYFADGLRAL